MASAGTRLHTVLRTGELERTRRERAAPTAVPAAPYAPNDDGQARAPFVSGEDHNAALRRTNALDRHAMAAMAWKHLWHSAIDRTVRAAGGPVDYGTWFREQGTTIEREDASMSDWLHAYLPVILFFLPIDDLRRLLQGLDEGVADLAEERCLVYRNLDSSDVPRLRHLQEKRECDLRVLLEGASPHTMWAVRKRLVRFNERARSNRAGDDLDAWNRMMGALTETLRSTMIEGEQELVCFHGMEGEYPLSLDWSRVRIAQHVLNDAATTFFPTTRMRDVTDKYSSTVYVSPGKQGYRAVVRLTVEPGVRRLDMARALGPMWGCYGHEDDASRRALCTMQAQSDGCSFS